MGRIGAWMSVPFGTSIFCGYWKTGSNKRCWFSEFDLHVVNLFYRYQDIQVVPPVILFQQDLALSNQKMHPKQPWFSRQIPLKLSDLNGQLKTSTALGSDNAETTNG